jgi:diguanylate cyclase (GGDEF)-like protein
MIHQIEKMMNIGVWQACPQNGSANWSASTAALLGLAEKSDAGDLTHLLSTLGDEDYKNVRQLLDQAVVDGQPKSYSCSLSVPGEDKKNLAFEISINPNRENEDLLLIGIVREDNQSQSLAKMRRVACYDALTGLPNQLLFREQLSYATRIAKRDRSIVAVLTIEVNDLRRISDAYGKGMSDQIIKAIGTRIGSSVRATDRGANYSSAEQQGGLARIEATQFAIVLTGIKEPQDAARVARRMLDQMSTPIFVDGIENYASISIGIAICPWDGDTADKIAQTSSLALDHARKAGSNRAIFFNRSMNAQAADRLNIEAGMRRALEYGEFVLHYQHRVHGVTGHVLGNEALIRWQHPEKGFLYPNSFISAAEESRLIVPIGNWVIEQACRQNRIWMDKGLPPVPVAVNVSSVQFVTPGFVSTVRRALQLSGIPPEYLELEITESVVMTDAAQVIEKLRELKSIGCLVAIDDFGTGFSSLSYLRDFPADALKIDRSFVTASTKDRKGAAITQAIIELAVRLDMSVIAEGVETEAERTLLLSQGCVDLQGFLFSKPCDPEKTEASWRKANAVKPEVQRRASHLSDAIAIV